MEILFNFFDDIISKMPFKYKLTLFSSRYYVGKLGI